MSTKVPAPKGHFTSKKPELSKDAIKINTKELFKFNPDYDFEAENAAEVQSKLSSLYGEPVVIEGTNRPIDKCAQLVKQGTATGILYTFRASDGNLYAVPIPMSVIYKLCDPV